VAFSELIVDAMARPFGQLCGVGLIGLLSWLGFTSLAATPSLPRRVVVAAPAALISGGKLPLTVGLSPRMPQETDPQLKDAKRQRSKMKTKITEHLTRKLKDVEKCRKFQLVSFLCRIDRIGMWIHI
jgi:hypothetical protein